MDQDLYSEYGKVFAVSLQLDCSVAHKEALELRLRTVCG